MKWNAPAGVSPDWCVRSRVALAVLLGVALARPATAAELELAGPVPLTAESARSSAGASQASRSLRLLAALSVGKGLRFNNPYRLATPLGDTPESVSLSATYLDVGLAALLPAVPRLEHGVALDVLLALDGIGQLGLTPSYLLLFEPRPSFGLRGRLGLPLVVAPDTSIGIEAGIGAQLPVAYGFGLTGELVGTVFFGAATEQKSVTTIPMLAVQLGLCFDERVLW
jgi:hypothetical protein